MANEGIPTWPSRTDARGTSYGSPVGWGEDPEQRSVDKASALAKGPAVMSSTPAQDPVVRVVNAIIDPGIRFADWVVASTSRRAGVTLGLATMVLGAVTATTLSSVLAPVVGPGAAVPWLAGLYTMGVGVRIAFESYATRS